MKKHRRTRQLNRDHGSRRALFRALISSLVEHEEIRTTQAKAKAVQSQFEKLLTKAKSGSLSARRQIQAVVQHPSVVAKLVNELAPRFSKIRGGYTKLVVVGNRRGDNAKIVKLALTREKTSSRPGSSSRKTKSKSSHSQTISKLASPRPPAAKPVKSAVKTVARVGKRGDR